MQQKGGNLVITALKDDYTGKDGVARPYTSARIKTKWVVSHSAYGRVEARDATSSGEGNLACVLDAWG